jgi:hypothetical protein
VLSVQKAQAESKAAQNGHQQRGQQKGAIGSPLAAGQVLGMIAVKGEQVVGGELVVDFH